MNLLIFIIFTIAQHTICFNESLEEIKEIQQEWKQWKQKFNKTYLSSEKKVLSNQEPESKRFRIFTTNIMKIKLHNRMNSPIYKLGTNAFSDMNLAELNSRFQITIELEQVKKFNANLTRAAINSNILIAESVDWVKSGYVAEIADQGVCGACYTFATVAAIESIYAIEKNLKNSVISFSEQQLLDCSYITYGYKNYGCNGGFAYSTLLYTYQNGLELSSSYPYIGTRSTCNHSPSKIVTKISNISKINFGDIQMIKRVLNKQPVIAHMLIVSDFYFYKSGIYSSKECPSNCNGGVNHMVTIVGYGIDKSKNNTHYWLIRNHWGTKWGEDGYFRIEMGKNMCCIEGFEYYPSL